MHKELKKINGDIKNLAESENKIYYFGRFLPSVNVMFIAEMPTIPPKNIGWYPEDNFPHLAGLFEKFGLGGSYITDIVKTSTKAGRPTQKEIDKYFPFLEREIELLKPKIIVALGDNAFKILRSKLGTKYNIKMIWHPAYVSRYNRWEKYEKQIKDRVLNSLQAAQP